MLGLFRKAHFFIEDAVEYIEETILVGQEDMDFLKIHGVVAPRNPDFQITVRPILLIKIADCPFENVRLCRVEGSWQARTGWRV